MGAGCQSRWLWWGARAGGQGLVPDLVLGPGELAKDLVLGPGELEEAGLGAGDVEQQRLARTRLQLKVSDLSHKLHSPHQTKSVYKKVGLNLVCLPWDPTSLAAD